MRAVTKPIVSDGKVKYVVQVLAPLAALESELRGLRAVLFSRVPIVIIIAILGALFIVRITLNPVDEIVNTIRQIRPDNLNVRLNVPNTGDEIARLAETFNDMLKDLERSFVAQRQIVQDISHELKTPLTILQGQQEVALRRNRSSMEYRDLLFSNLEEIEKMRRIVRDLLLLAKFDKESHTVEMKFVDLNKMVRELLDQEIQTMAQVKNIEVKLTERAAIMINASEDYLRLVLMNLLDNAIKYTPIGGTIEVTLGQDTEYVMIAVKDTGQGIPEKDLPYIFDRFYRVDKARRSGEGFGLGLSVVKSIVKIHKGEVHVQSQVNQGTTFSVYLPASV